MAVIFLHGMVQEAKPLLTLREASELTRTSQDWLKTQIDRGLLGCFRVAGRILISPEQVTDFLTLMERRPKIGGRGFTAFARDGVPMQTTNGWVWRRSRERAVDGDEV